jgi:hypothetical protein
MAFPESSPSQQFKKYEEPRWADFKEVTDGKVVEGMRVARIISRKHLVLEPIQEDVLRYPPTPVQQERDPDFIARYINMSPTDWHEIIHGPGAGQ